MRTEAYSKRMAVVVRRELRQADGARFAELLAYYKVRGGPGLALALAQKELAERQTRQMHNRLYNTTFSPCQPSPTPTPIAPSATSR